MTRLDRWELELNEALAGDVRDTTSPDAMTSDLKAILLGDVLSSGSRNQLTEWMVANQTGLDRLRANLPPAWRVADKTGNNSEHTSNDIAVIWPACLLYTSIPIISPRSSFGKNMRRSPKRRRRMAAT